MASLGRTTIASLRRTAITTGLGSLTVTSIASTASVSSSHRDTRIPADLQAVFDNLVGILFAADGARAVTETVHEVGVGAKTLQIASFAAKLLSFSWSHHVAGTGLL
jgi:hypothetical protein